MCVCERERERLSMCVCITQVTARECVKLALGVGYRFLDCAQVRTKP
jgi:hypothetical protein